MSTIIIQLNESTEATFKLLTAFEHQHLQNLSGFTSNPTSLT